MSKFLLLHGAASTGWFWHRVVAQLHRAGHETAVPDLPCAEVTADLHSYVEVACEAAAQFGSAPITVVAQSMSGLMTPVIAHRRPVERIVLLAAMIPRSKETGLQWWEATGHAEAQRDYLESLGFSASDVQNPEVVFVHDFDERLKVESLNHAPEQYSGPLETPVPFEVWPDVPTHVIAPAADRFFPLEFMRKLALDRLGLEVDVIPGGHAAALTQSAALVQQLLRYQSTEMTVT